MVLYLIRTVEEHSELPLPSKSKEPLAQSLASLAVVFHEDLSQVRKLDLPVFDTPVELYQRFFDHADIFRVEVLALVVPGGHGDNQCREQRLFFPRELSGKRINRYRVVKIHGEILPGEKLAYPLVATTFIDDENHRVEP